MKIGEFNTQSQARLFADCHRGRGIYINLTYSLVARKWVVYRYMKSNSELFKLWSNRQREELG